MIEDTIVAISTSLGVGAISIIRVSGDKSIELVNKIFKGKDLTKVNTHTIHYGFIYDDDNKIDEVLVSIMKSPKTFTKEDVVEINCHGGIMTTKKIVELLIRLGARQAEPGEFTKRAFLNGRIDLLEAEAVMDIIEAKSEQNLKVALNQLTGSVSKKIENLRQDIVNLLATIEVNIDYPEYEDIEQMTNSKLELGINEILNKLEIILKQSENGQIKKNGIKTVILGKPNVGKSSLLNALLEEDKAIVTDIEGTTRDIVEGTININGLVLNMIDTAGIRKTLNKIEEIGVKKSLEIMKQADLTLYLLNNNNELTKEDEELISSLDKNKVIIVVNKIDLENNLSLASLKDYKIVKISIKDNLGIENLKNTITELFDDNKIVTKDLTYLTNARSIALLKKSKESLSASLNSIKNMMPVDMVEIDLKEAWNLLGEIIGKTYQDELIDQLFSQFCLGK